MQNNQEHLENFQIKNSTSYIWRKVVLATNKLHERENEIIKLTRELSEPKITSERPGGVHVKTESQKVRP